jgi:hypothetical protein
MASAVAFKSDSSERTTGVQRRAGADLLMSFTFSAGGKSCALQLIPTTDLGMEIAQRMARISLEKTDISIAIGVP